MCVCVSGCSFNRSHVLRPACFGNVLHLNDSFIKSKVSFGCDVFLGSASLAALSLRFETFLLLVL